MIRILYLISGLGIGGAESQLLQTVSHLNRHEIEPHVCTLAAYGPLAERFREARIPVYHLGRSNRIDPRQSWRFVGLIRQVKPDIIHSHMFFSNLLARFTALVAGRPVVISQDHGLSPWKKGFWANVDHLTSPLVCQHITVSECSRQLRLQREQFQPEKVCVIYNAVDVDSFDPSLYPPNSWDKRIVIGSVASLKAVKSIDTLIRAVALLAQQGKIVELRLVGDGPDRDVLERLVGDLGMADEVSFLGNRHNIPFQLSQMHIFVLPSVREDFPVSLLEAMSMEKACVASEVGGIPEALQDGQNGWLVPTEQPFALAQRLSYILDHPDEARAVGKQARQTVLNKFRIEQQITKLSALYEQAIG